MRRPRGPLAAALGRRFDLNLIELRGRVGLSQIGTAERAGLTRSKIGLLERGGASSRLDSCAAACTRKRQQVPQNWNNLAFTNPPN